MKRGGHRFAVPPYRGVPSGLQATLSGLRRESRKLRASRAPLPPPDGAHVAGFFMAVGAGVATA